MSDPGAIVVIGAGPLNAAMREALVAAHAQGVTVVFKEEPPLDIEAVIQNMPRPPELNLACLRQTYTDRATPNQPWYSRFQKRRRKSQNRH